MIELNDKTYTYYIYVYPLPPGPGGENGGDVMGCVQRNVETGKITATYRHRYHEDKFAFNSLDRKKWFSGELPDDDEVEVFLQIQVKLAESLGSEVEVLRCNCLGAEGVTEQMEKSPNFHLRKGLLPNETEEEYRDRQRQD